MSRKSHNRNIILQYTNSNQGDCIFSLSYHYNILGYGGWGVGGTWLVNSKSHTFPKEVQYKAPYLKRPFNMKSHSAKY